ncbi:glycosyltransferase family A protein, partial [Shigella sp. FJ200518]|uniref:glycosyltransferase family A protein n=1 Tax=Shigella sp. FJ200518 TaxID=3156212 RepID=UPI0033941FA4
APENLIIPNNCILLDEAKPGSYAARNKALKIAKGDIYAFTDSDCQPKEDWLEVAINFFIDNTEVERIGGEISLFTKNEKANWFEIYEMFFCV